MKNKIAIVLLLVSIVTATTIAPGKNYNLLRGLFRNHHFSESASMGKTILQKYPDFFKNDWTAYFTAISIYKMGFEEEGITLLSEAVETYSLSPVALNCELLLYLIDDKPMRDRSESGGNHEQLLFQKMVTDMSLSAQTIEEYLDVDVETFLEGQLVSPECDSLRAVLLEGETIRFTKELFPVAMSLIAFGMNNSDTYDCSYIDVASFIAIFLVDYESELESLPEWGYLNITRRLRRLSENDRKVSQRVSELYDML